MAGTDSHGSGGDALEAGHAPVDGGAAAGELVELGEFLIGSGEADLESLGFAEPALAPGLVDAGEQVAADLGDAVTLGRIRPKEGASEAPLTELT